jgi:hypothetical protein
LLYFLKIYGKLSKETIAIKTLKLDSEMKIKIKKIKKVIENKHSRERVKETKEWIWWYLSEKLRMQ